MTFQIKKITELIDSNGPFTYSFEVTPDISESQLEKLAIQPLFFSITWHASNHQCKDLKIAPLKLAEYLKSNNKHVLLHVTCELMKLDYLTKLLDYLKSEGFCNLFVLLGENYDPAASDFKNSQDMIDVIRKKHGDYFCIGVAGFPDCSDENLQRLKSKVDSGANFIITQAFFEAHIFKEYSNKCKQFGITVPIVPGLFPFETEKQLQGFINLCKVKVSSNFTIFFTNAKGKNISGMDIMSKLIKELHDDCNHIHLFTVNKLQIAVSLVEK